MLATLNIEDFAPFVGQAFQVGGLEPPAALHLDNASAARSSSGASRASFALLFRGPLQPPLPQGTYALRHPTRGPLDIFLVPVGADTQGLQYEAIFN